MQKEGLLAILIGTVGLFLAVAQPASAATGILVDMQYSTSTNLNTLTPLGASQITQALQQAITDGHGNDYFYWTGSFTFPTISNDWGHKCGYNGWYGAPGNPYISIDSACLNGFGPNGDLNGTPNVIYECISALSNGASFYYPDQHGMSLPCIKYVWNGTAYVAAPTPAAATTTPQYCTPGVDANCNDNIMFLPGIQGSRLYESPGNQVWESDDTGAMRLIMNSDGSSQQSDIYTKDIIGTISLTGGTFANVYRPFINEMNRLKSINEIVDWEAVPYDWRLSLDQIVSSGAKINPDGGVSYLTSTTSPYIFQEVKRLASSSRTGKVTIVAHSNGGLVTKKLVQVLGPNASKYIDKIIFVAVPSLGTPQAIEGILSGNSEAVPSHLSAPVARFLANNLPTAYNLLPSPKYFLNVDDPVISFDPSTMQDWITKYATNKVHSTDRLSAFMLDAGHATLPTPQDTDLNSPIHANGTLFNQATLMHNNSANGLDNWVPPHDIQLYEIAGWGNETLSGITYKRVPKSVCLQFDSRGTCIAFGQTQELTFDPNSTLDGDGTVVEPSALWSNGATSTVYFVNLDAFNKDNDKIPLPDIFQLLFTDHGRIFKVAELNELIVNIIENGVNAAIPSKYISISQPVSTATNRLHFILHSPLTLGFVNSEGNYTGSTATTSIFTVPGVNYERYGDVQWLSIPKELAGKVVMQATATGSFTLDIAELNGNITSATTTFAAVPVATSTKVSIAINPYQSAANTGVLMVDFNGDGQTDLTLNAKSGSIVIPTFYNWKGFLQPINDTNVQPFQASSVFKAGSTVPVKFQLRNADGAVTQASSSPIWVQPQQDGSVSVAIDESIYTGSPALGNVFKWDSGSQQYIYNWSTKGLMGGYWYKIGVRLDDGTTHTVVIGLK